MPVSCRGVGGGQDDERMKRMAALNAIYEEGVKRLSWGNTARVGGGKKKRAATVRQTDRQPPPSSPLALRER